MATADINLDEIGITSRLLNLILDMSTGQKLEILKLLDKWENEKLRKHPRKPWIIAINYATEHQAFKDVSKDISAGGVFIETKMPLTVGREIRMKFRLPRSRKLIQAHGKIVRSNSRGIGVKFKRQS